METRSGPQAVPIGTIDPLRYKAQYNFIEFIRPDGYWPYPYTIEQAFGVFAWMVQTGKGYGDKVPYITKTVDGLLSCSPECGYTDVTSIASLNDLRQRFHYALLGDRLIGPRVAQWRKTFHITPSGSNTIAFPHYIQKKLPMPETDIKKMFDALFSAKGTLNVQLNEYHAEAKEVYYCKARPYNGLWRWTMLYGYDSSGWTHELAQQQKGESFLDCTIRAYEALSAIMPGMPLIITATTS